METELLQSADGRSIKGQLIKDGQRRCARCREFKPLEDFHDNHAMAGGKGSYCKPCAQEYTAMWRRKNPRSSEETREYWQKYYAKNKEVIQAKRRAYIKANPLEATLKIKCYIEFDKAMRKGLIENPYPAVCQGCGIVGRKKEPHHPNYNEPLNVIWLCKSCHNKVHRNGHDRIQR